jgi:hypothetical protein
MQQNNTAKTGFLDGIWKFLLIFVPHYDNKNRNEKNI